MGFVPEVMRSVPIFDIHLREQSTKIALRCGAWVLLITVW